ncbi:hypothetical protein FM110_09950 [Brachybacterium nesterenkovii]|uniref:Uncharacterized protein n=1 Tax=Brachybacterium nesterenkovii TaxID=47847 RepID=A0A1X6X3V0_9MICO|nr:hypothetical protein FM110_09950 [Brachybacterium nesterenkovii]
MPVELDALLDPVDLVCDELREAIHLRFDMPECRCIGDQPAQVVVAAARCRGLVNEDGAHGVPPGYTKTPPGRGLRLCGRP